MAKVFDLGKVERFESVTCWSFFVIRLHRQEQFAVVLDDSRAFGRDDLLDGIF